MDKIYLAWLTFLLLTLGSCVSAPPVRSPGAWMSAQELRSWNYLRQNISPTEPKRAGGPRPTPGIVVAAQSKHEPDYYFHWVRDASSVMHTTLQIYLRQRPYVEHASPTPMMTEYLKLSRRLQLTPAKFGLGEPRFSVTAEPDTSPWSRPQYDGPALRALGVLQYLKWLEQHPDEPGPRALAEQVLFTDLDFVTTVWDQRGFDVWEEYQADNYHTRLVQLAALEKAAEWLKSRPREVARRRKYEAVAVKLSLLLNDHWDPARGFLRSQLAIVATDGYTTKKTDLDSAVIVAVIEADRDGLEHSVLDDRVQATAAVLSALFQVRYPINRDPKFGYGYGRYAGDTYFGGNPWYLITAHFAQLDYRIAARLAAGKTFKITRRNREFLRGVVAPEFWPEIDKDQELQTGSRLHSQLITGLMTHGDKIMLRLQEVTPSDGQMYEQFDQVTGRPVSARGIGWSHAALIDAVLERPNLP